LQSPSGTTARSRSSSRATRGEQRAVRSRSASRDRSMRHRCRRASLRRRPDCRQRRQKRPAPLRSQNSRAQVFGRKSVGAHLADTRGATTRAGPR
jgi:hypothetical protein